MITYSAGRIRFTARTNYCTNFSYTMSTGTALDLQVSNRC